MQIRWQKKAEDILAALIAAVQSFNDVPISVRSVLTKDMTLLQMI